jgi:hypothetical protein
VRPKTTEPIGSRRHNCSRYSIVSNQFRKVIFRAYNKDISLKNKEANWISEGTEPKLVWAGLKYGMAKKNKTSTLEEVETLGVSE